VHEFSIYCIGVLGLFSLTCKQPFEGAEGNLQRLMEKNTQWLEQHPVDDTVSVQNADRIHQLIARFLMLTDIWFFDKKSLVESHQVRFLWTCFYVDNIDSVLLCSHSPI
jgi:hypothetical protein